MSSMSKKQKSYLFLIYILTIFFLVHSIVSKYIIIEFQDYLNIAFFSLLVVLAESFTVPFKNISFSLSFTIVLISYIVLGPFNCIITCAIGYLFRVVKCGPKDYVHVFNTPWYGTMFNCCALVLPILVSNYLYVLCGGKFNDVSLAGNVIPIIIFSLGYLLCNIIIVSTMLSIKTEKNLVMCIFGNVWMQLLCTLLSLPISIMAVIMFQKYSYIGLTFIVFFISLLRYTLILYSTSKEQLTETISALMNSVEARDKYTNGHSRRVAEISTLIAKHLKLTVWDIEKLNVAAMLHDVGKIGISDNILQKPGKLTDEEFAIIKSHPEIGMSIIKDIKNIDYVHPIVRHHHERYDGKGYPDGKKGEELSLMVYIVQLADAVDAMASDRPYRRGLPQEVIIEEIKKGAGTQFHPKVSRAYLDILEEKGSKAFMKDENKLII